MTSSISNKRIAQQFGSSLDKDDFNRTMELLDEMCEYQINEEVFIGPYAICKSYQDNMIVGCKKLDKLTWGTSQVEKVNPQQYIVLFTDYLVHANQSHTHRCNQKLTIGDSGLIIRIEHIHEAEEHSQLNAFYKKVGIL